MPDRETLIRILDRARWAPSGDNTQPWRFEILGDDHVLVHGFDTRDHCVYDLDGHASQLAVGALLETLRIAATVEGLRAQVERRPDTPETHLLIDVRFRPDASLAADPLAAFIEKRVVQRRPMSTRSLTCGQKQTLEASLPEGYQVIWFEGFPHRLRMAKLLFDSAKIRLNIPEAYEVHKSVIEWGARYSEDRIPSRAVGVDPMTERLMRWAMQSWARVEFLNKWMFGDFAPRVQLDLLPGLFCAAHYGLLAPASLRTIDDQIAAGQSMQRFWLTAASLGLLIQPEMTPVIFTRYHRHGRSFTNAGKGLKGAETLNARLKWRLNGVDLDTLFFMGRLGFGPDPSARSVRLELSRLLLGSLQGTRSNKISG
jgi:hypothetical protein